MTKQGFVLIAFGLLSAVAVVLSGLFFFALLFFVVFFVGLAVEGDGFLVGYGLRELRLADVFFTAFPIIVFLVALLVFIFFSNGYRLFLGFKVIPSEHNLNVVLVLLPDHAFRVRQVHGHTRMLRFPVSRPIKHHLLLQLERAFLLLSVSSDVDAVLDFHLLSGGLREDVALLFQVVQEGILLLLGGLQLNARDVQLRREDFRLVAEGVQLVLKMVFGVRRRVGDVGGPCFGRAFVLAFTVLITL